MIRSLVLAIAIAIALPLGAAADDAARSFAHTVTTTAARVEPPTGKKSYEWIRCWQAGVTPVYLGGSDVTPRNGYPICSHTATAPDAMGHQARACETDALALEAGSLFAVVSEGSQSIVCIVVQ